VKSNARFRPPNAASVPVLGAPPTGPVMRMRRIVPETAHDAVERARAMPWWPRVKREQPYSCAAWWVWTVRA